jgi:molybdopterin molybdotransferase
MALISVEEALARVLAGAAPTAPESVGLVGAPGRVLAEDVVAQLTQPPFNSSAMDGYAVRASELAKTPSAFKVIGESQAGRGFDGTLGASETVRILTGAPLPEGADTVVIQETVERDGDDVIVREAPKAGANVRRAGSDFRQGQTLLTAGVRLDAAAITLAAAAGHARLTVRRKPAVAILATGDELVEPGTSLGPDQIVSSNPYGLAALIERAGGSAAILGIAGDTREAIAEKLKGAAGADVLVTIGGASVGDRDVVRPALEDGGMTLDFWKVAIRPGKPMLFGALGATRVLGLPGNPLSCLIAARVFLVPLLYRLLGSSILGTETTAAVLAHDLAANGARQHYLPAKIAYDAKGVARVTALPAQDSARLTGLVGADVLIVRAPDAPAAPAGTIVPVLPAEF